MSCHPGGDDGILGFRGWGSRSKDMCFLIFIQLPGLLCLNVVALVAVGIGGGVTWGSTALGLYVVDIGDGHQHHSRG